MKCPDCAALLIRVEGLEGAVAALRAAQSAGAGPAPGSIANDQELDDPQWGDPMVKNNPPRWNGVSCIGRHFSQCPPEFLDSLAGFKDWSAAKNEGVEEKKKYVPYERADARRARGWAVRIRAGWKPRAAVAEEWKDVAEDEIPF